MITLFTEWADRYIYAPLERYTNDVIKESFIATFVGFKEVIVTEVDGCTKVLINFDAPEDETFFILRYV